MLPGLLPRASTFSVRLRRQLDARSRRSWTLARGWGRRAGWRGTVSPQQSARAGCSLLREHCHPSEQGSVLPDRHPHSASRPSAIAGLLFSGACLKEKVFFFQRVLGSPVTNHLLRRGIFPINFILWSFSLYCPSFSLLGRFPCLMTVFKHVCCCSWNTPLLLNPGSKKSIIYLTSWNFGGSLHLSGLSTKRLYSASLPGSGLWICVKSHPSDHQDLPECGL